MLHMPVEARAEVAGAVTPAAPLCPIDVAGEELESAAHSSRKAYGYGKRKQLVHEALSKFTFIPVLYNCSAYINIKGIA